MTTEEWISHPTHYARATRRIHDTDGAYARRGDVGDERGRLRRRGLRGHRSDALRPRRSGTVMTPVAPPDDWEPNEIRNLRETPR